MRNEILQCAQPAAMESGSKIHDTLKLCYTQNISHDHPASYFTSKGDAQAGVFQHFNAPSAFILEQFDLTNYPLFLTQLLDLTL